MPWKPFNPWILMAPVGEEEDVSREDGGPTEPRSSADELRQALQIITTEMGNLEKCAIGLALDPLDKADYATPSVEAIHRALKKIEEVAVQLETCR